jgi:hypothetical protein
VRILRGLYNADTFNKGSHPGRYEATFATSSIACFVREFPTLPPVESIAITDEGRFFYVTDEDEGIHLRLTRILAG